MTALRALLAIGCTACAATDVSPTLSPPAPSVDTGASSPLEPEPPAAQDSEHAAHDVRETSPATQPDTRTTSPVGDDLSNIADLPPAPAALDLAHPADIAGEPEVWLKGVTHVHAKASGDSSEPPANVIAWYESHHYDFIVLTDHNRVSELDARSNTRGQITLRDPQRGLIVFSGIELTHNPIGCLPQGDPSRNCRIHVNLIGPTARPGKRLEWAERRSHARLDMYRAAVKAQTTLGGIGQINHPQWLWGMTPDLLVELSKRGLHLMEVANAQFARWNAGDANHLSTDALWDAALMQGATVWGTASDDAHHYEGHGQWPPGGGWVVVRARREPHAILDALANGRFYASNGVVLDHAEVDGNELRVEVDPGAPGHYTIDFIENGRRISSITGKVARRPIPTAGYLRAVVTRDDGKRAWVQPARK